MQSRKPWPSMQVTTPDDMQIAEGFLMSRGLEQSLDTKHSDFSEASVS